MDMVAKGLSVAAKSLPTAAKKELVQQLREDKELSEIMFDAALSELREMLAVAGLEKKSEGISETVGSAKVKPNRKELGRGLREYYIVQLRNRGVRIERDKGVWARTSGGVWAAIAVATELEQRPNRWFLGLPEADVLQKLGSSKLVVVLLCKTESGALLDFVIPHDILQKLVGSLSKSKGQLKFNLKKVGDRYWLVNPGVSDLDVSDLLGAASAFEVNSGNSVEEKSKPKCLQCNSNNVLPIVYGLPSQELLKQAEEKKVVLGGCVVYKDAPQWHCTDCGAQWRDGYSVA